MLTLRPIPPNALLSRGRSRQVSHSALARHASEERRVTLLPVSHTVPIVSPVPKLAAPYPPPFMRSPSPSPPSSASMSPDYYDSPPSPPRSLEDQVHVAYALDDIHLAKILLLRLKGIEVTSDDDPRIAAVQDEDFDFCFVPNGRLMDENDEKAMKEMQAREVERLEEYRRQERLRHCEHKWEEEKRRLREERLAVIRRRELKKQEEEERRRRVESQESRRAAEEERRRAMKTERRASRKVVSFNHLPPADCSQSLPQPQFVYDFPFTPSAPRTPPPVSSSSHSSRTIFPSHSFDDAASVPFTDVLKSMQGPLFPVSHDERARRSPSRGSRSRTRSQPKQRREDRLLDALLVEIEYSREERRKAKGKQRAQPRRTRPPCLACNAPSPPPLSPVSSSSSSSSPIPRTSSWLSFRNSSSSASSSSTDLTTPSSSPIVSPKSSWFAASRPRSWLPDPAVTLPTALRHSCYPHSGLIPVASADSPLVIDPPLPCRSVPISHQGRQRSISTVRVAKEGAGVLVRRMSIFVELAKGFQNAYVTTALFSVASSYDSLEDRDFTGLYSSDRKKSASQETSSLAKASSRSNDITRAKLMPAGYRVSPIDVAAFLRTAELHLGSQSSSAVAEGSLSPRYIPLTSPFPPSETPRTVLPDPLPYQLFFKPIPTPTRSPFRFHALSELHTMYPSSDPAPTAQPGQVNWRIRSVGNPVHLRLKALRNIVWGRGVLWEGVARETALGGGRERVVGVAYEGVGRSSLSRSSSRSSF